MTIFSPFVSYRTRKLKLDAGSLALTDRQERVGGFVQDALTNARVILIGAGGLGGEIGMALVRKGVGKLAIFDHDRVDPTNLNRQRFYRRDLYQNKAGRLARNLAKEGFLGIIIQGYSLSFEDAWKLGIDLLGNVAIVGVDNNPGRIAASRFYREQGIPVIFTAVSRTANNGYVFIQEPERACFACLFPRALKDETYPCPAAPVVLDILKVVSGIVVCTVDSLLMKRPRYWNFKDVFLDGSVPGSDWQIPRRKNCALCQETRFDLPKEKLCYEDYSV